MAGGNPPEPGIYADVDAEDYHRGPGVSRSQLLILRDRSPAHLRIETDHPRPTTPAMALGTAVHCRVLEPELFAATYVPDPMPGRQTKAAREARAELEAAGKIVVHTAPAGADIWDRDDWRRIEGMASAVEAHPIVSTLLRHGQREQTVYWRDETTGLLCKARPDHIDPDVHCCVLDLKTSALANLVGDKLWRTVDTHGYHVQAAWYLDGLAAVGVKLERFVFAFIQKEPPYAILARTLPAEKVEHGRATYRHLLRIYAECVAYDEWPGWSPAISEIEFPPWSYRS